MNLYEENMMNLMKKYFYYNARDDIWQEENCEEDDIELRLKHIRIDDERFSYVYLPIYWSVELLPSRVVELVLYIKRVTIEEEAITEIEEKEWTIDCDIKNSKVQGWPASIISSGVRDWRNGYACGANITFPELLAARHVDIPAVAIDIAIDYLKEVAKDKYGFRPCYLGDVHGLLQMIAYCESPLDPNIYILKDVLGQNAYIKIKELGKYDSYRELCKHLAIENPPPSLRKAYVLNPESILVYVFLRQCGFRDINIIRRFFYRDEIFGYRLLSMHYNDNLRVLGLSGAGAFDLENFQQYCRWLLQHRSEKTIAPRLLRWCNENLTYEALDTLRMFVVARLDENEGLVDAMMQRRLLNDDLTREVHDALVEELFIVRPDIVNNHPYVFRDGRKLKHTNTVYEYNDKEHALEMELGEYTFHLPKDSNELSKWGNLFHNCVASYDCYVISRFSLIVAMKNKEKYVACIEVKQGRITQALGYCNQRLPIDYRNVIAEWAKGNRLFYRL